MNIYTHIDKFCDKLDGLGIHYTISNRNEYTCHSMNEVGFELELGNGDFFEVFFIEGEGYDGVCLSIEASYTDNGYTIVYNMDNEEENKEFWNSLTNCDESYIIVNNTLIPKPIMDITKVDQEVLYIPEANKYMCRAVFTNDIRKMGYRLLYKSRDDAKEASKRLFNK